MLKVTSALSIVSMLLSSAAGATSAVSETATVIRTYPHDPGAFTEGLLVKDGWLYESTGLPGHSFIRKIRLSTGEVVKAAAVPDGLFGEGVVDWGNRLYSFVLDGERGFVWSVDDLRREGGWHYTGAGWGLTHDKRHIVMSDGTATLRFLRPGSMKVVRRLAVTADGRPVRMLNELEYVHGEILANVWMTDRIARIDPATGRVKGWIDLKGLWAQVGDLGRDAVPNGIAYDEKTDRLFVTGKNWPLIFEIARPGQ